jgi:hypothetical protein
MKSIYSTAALLLAASSASFAATNTYNVFTDASATIQYFQVGGASEITDSYFFEVGVFTPGLDYSPNNAVNIAANFRSFGPAVNWDSNLIDAGLGGASLSFSFDDISGYPNGITANSVLSIWAYDTKTPGATTDWMIVTNPSWIVAALTTTPGVNSADFTITDGGTVASFGTISGNQYISAIAPAIPEPSSFAAIAGFAVLGLVVSRRHRA